MLFFSFLSLTLALPAEAGLLLSGVVERTMSAELRLSLLSNVIRMQVKNTGNESFKVELTGLGLDNTELSSESSAFGTETRNLASLPLGMALGLSGVIPAQMQRNINIAWNEEALKKAKTVSVRIVAP